jgi:hypothetical protein
MNAKNITQLKIRKYKKGKAGNFKATLGHWAAPHGMYAFHPYGNLPGVTV